MDFQQKTDAPVRVHRLFVECFVFGFVTRNGKH